MFRKLLKIAGFLVLMVFLIVTLAFTFIQSKNITCRNIEVEFRNDEVIKLKNDEIVRMVKAADDQLLSKNLEQIDAELIEKAVESHPAVLKAEVYKVIAKDTTAYKGIVTVKVKHREPLVRMMSNNGSYYLDQFGGKIPISANYTANVLAVTGYFSEKYATEQLLPFILFIENDDFWKSQIEQVHIEKNGEIILTPLVGNHIIELGKLDNYQKKMRNMKAFYGQVLANNNWNKYQSVSLKYKNQVVAKKR